MSMQLSNPAVPLLHQPEKEAAIITQFSAKKIRKAKGIADFFSRLNPFNWYNDFSNIEITMED